MCNVLFQVRLEGSLGFHRVQETNSSGIYISLLFPSRCTSVGVVYLSVDCCVVGELDTNCFCLILMQTFNFMAYQWNIELGGVRVREREGERKERISPCSCVVTHIPLGCMMVWFVSHPFH